MSEFLIRNNLPAFQYLNIEQMPNNLLAGNFAQRALNLFRATEMFIRLPEPTVRWLNVSGISMIILLRSIA